MKLWHGLPRRVFLAAALCAGLGVGISSMVLSGLFLQQALRRISLLMPQLDAIQLGRCERDPARFGRELGDDLRIDVYDPHTLLPAAADGPPIDRTLLARLEAGEDAPTTMYFLEHWAGGGLRRAAPDGPCSLIMMRWHTGGRERMTAMAAIFGFIALTIAGSVVLASLFAIRPMTQRLARLRGAAQRVGVDAGYASAADAEADDIGQLSEILDGAHRRILTDADAMAQRQRALEQHLGAVAHDMRTPLASLQMSLEHLSASALAPDADALVRGALADVVYMGALTENLHLASRLADGADPLRGGLRSELGALVDQVSRRFGMLARLRRIEVHGARPDEPVEVLCNPAMAEQALANLVHNAVAHGEPGGHVAVLLEAADGGFTLTVVDDGPGVPPVDLPRLGERTFRSDEARRRDPKGSGLGLAITTEVCQRAGWTLVLGAEEPRGLRATITGPTAPAPHTLNTSR
jgi:signal transduction histidine kinase